MMRSVFVTGYGVICPSGSDSSTFWKTLTDGHAHTAAPRCIPGSPLRVAELCDETFLDGIDVKPVALDRSAQFAVKASHEALAMAGIVKGHFDPVRIGIVLGNGGAGLTTLDEQFRRLYGDKQPRCHPLAVAKSMSSSSASWVSIAFGIRGPTFVIASACASGTHAIGVAMQMIQSGIVDVALAGGCEAPLNEGTIRAWDSMRILSPDVCRPFSKGRLGLTLGEGAGVLVLEAEDHARARGATCHARLAGFACSADAADMFNPSAEGMEGVMREAVANAGLALSDIGYINAHGTGTMANDVTESRAVCAVFNDAPPPTSSTKSMTGHGLGASGGVEAVATVMALAQGLLPPTANFLEPDPDCPLDCIPNVARKAQALAALSNSFAFGGLNASLVLTRA
ncbi:beta-ketoacyl synthase [Rhizobium sp. SSA_523]|uniref:beta-ketoacyl-[acyl-carrier-protein] synthase family protein n=1 Tax=Rhizobium sp. SSA_523 TaxID=2952477 RepID=UPI00209046C0|nr:beta-ketoacyl-[acyl-carrier-protein] synthase family protein [Rhizobium sp. SSA_523]MCO5732444.1 beta-ketoacyl-[acyl-carrier-protein] synthase family protein [Rhizobium sp. SSA_523]WKC22413.1 beta-ketoacyl-[acyl-carrier-protein] synthase family protein [Rhizobium sp. SSA_523]